MKKIIILLLVFTGQVALCQNLTGTVKDSILLKEIPYANIIVKNHNNEVLSGTISDDDGNYSMRIKKGSYILEISFIGYKTKVETLTIEDNTTYNVLLQEDVISLNEAVLIGEISTVKQFIDKKVINVGKDLLSSGGNAATVLNQISEIQADENGSISLRGSSNVNVLVNGKPSPLSTNELLKQINAGNISKVEVITSPSAKYQANGLTGIINIITDKKVKKGFSISSSAGTNTLGGKNAGTTIDLGKEHINYSVGFSYNNSIFEGEGNQFRDGSNPFDRKRNFNFNGKVYTVNTGLDWFLNKSNEVSVAFEYTDNGHDIVNDFRILQNDRSSNQLSKAEHSHKTFSVNGNYRHTFKNEEDYLEVDAQFSNNENILNSSLVPNFNLQDNKTDNDVFIANIAFDNRFQLNDNTMLEAGGLWNKQTLKNERVFTENNTNISSERFNTQQNTLAAYTMFKYQKNDISFQAGLRGELFNRDAVIFNTGINIENKYANLFPSVHTSYAIAENQKITMGFNRRTSRPDLEQVNPISFRFDEFRNFEGNPNLKPEFSNNFDASYQLIKGVFRFATTLSYRLKNNAIVSTNTLDADGANVIMPINSGKTNVFGATVSLTGKPVKWYTNTIDLNWNVEKFKVQPEEFTNDSNKTYSVLVKNDFKMTPNARASLTWRLNGRSENFYGYGKSNQGIDIGFSHKLFAENNGNISVRVTDIFNTRTYGGFTLGTNFSENFSYKPASRVAYVSFTYRIDGERKKRNKIERDYGNGVID